MTKELSPPGTLFNNRTEIPFLFKNMDKEFESYHGRNVSVRYVFEIKVLLLP
jgi:Vacuolar protein sorting-associated protein 26